MKKNPITSKKICTIFDKKISCFAEPLPLNKKSQALKLSTQKIILLHYVKIKLHIEQMKHSQNLFELIKTVHV